MSTQFGAVGYIITPYSTNNYVKVRGRSKFMGVRTPNLPAVVTPMNIGHVMFRYMLIVSFDQHELHPVL